MGFWVSDVLINQSQDGKIKDRIMNILAKLFPDQSCVIAWHPQKVPERDRFILTQDLSQRSQKTHKPYGSNGLTPYARRAISSIIALFWRKWPGNLGFYTLTCPVPQVEQFNENLPEIQRRFFQELKRIYARRGQAFRYVSVIEYQKRGALHIHFIAPARRQIVRGRARSLDWIVSAEELRVIWSRVICKVLRIKYQRFPASIDAQLCIDNPSKYLCKYLSKEKSRVEDGGGATAAPPRWWSTDKISLRCFRASIKHLDADQAYPIWRNPEIFCRYHKWIEMDSPEGDEQRIIALFGILKEEFFKSLYPQEKMDLCIKLLTDAEVD
jgi:hypothetical protein